MITGYNNLPISKYQRILDILKARKDDIDAHAAILAILNDKTEEEILNLSLVDYQKLSERASFLMEDLPKFKGRISKEYRIGDMVLVPTTSAKKLTAAQYIDYQTLIKEEGRLVELVSVVLIPKGCSYMQGYDIADVQEAIAQMPVQDVAELSAFFLKKFQSSINYSLICLELHLRMMFKKEERKGMMMVVRDLRSLLKNGDGLRMLMQSARS